MIAQPRHDGRDHVEGVGRVGLQGLIVDRTPDAVPVRRVMRGNPAGRPRSSGDCRRFSTCRLAARRTHRPMRHRSDVGLAGLKFAGAMSQIAGTPRAADPAAGAGARRLDTPGAGDRTGSNAKTT
ncbi:MAG: hypothetical protein AB7P21_15055 [Lautropia sp.]